MFDSQIEYLMNQEEQKSRNLQEFKLTIPREGSIKTHMINSANPEHLKSTPTRVHYRNGKKVETRTPVVRTAPVNVPQKNAREESNNHGRQLMSEKDMFKMAVGRLGDEI